jgi:hypothetical protein
MFYEPASGLFQGDSFIFLGGKEISECFFLNGHQRKYSPFIILEVAQCGQTRKASPAV